MSLRKSPTLTPALLASNRSNAQKSTGPRTARGKAVSRLNRLRTGARSREYLQFYSDILDAPLGRVAETAWTLILEGRGSYHPRFIDLAMVCQEVFGNDPRPVR